MNADKDIWYLIAEQIDNPETFMNFSLVCKLFAGIATKLNPQKKNQFAKKVSMADFPGCPCCGIDFIEGFKLPNGNWHGEYSKYDSDYNMDIYIVYDNGVEVSKKIISHNDNDDNDETVD